MFWFFKKSINKVKEKHQAELLKKKGVLGVGVGHKIVEGKDTGRDAIVVVVEKKLPETVLLTEEKVPSRIDGIETDVIDAGGIIEPMQHRQKHRPVIGGISGKVEGGTACSIALICFKDGKEHLLTNEHCVHNRQDKTGKKFLQPSPADGGRMTDAIGIINNPPRIKNSEVNKIDCNIVPLDKSIPYDLTVLGLENYPKKWVKPAVGMKFVKIGRTTGKTLGTISHINALAKVNYGGDLGVCEFFPCIFALQNNYNIVSGGDSGSCIFNEEGVIGQTFAAAPNLAIFLVGEIIRDELGITLDKPMEGYVALGDWLSINGLEVITKTRTNIRDSIGLGDNLIRVLPFGTKLRIMEEGGVKDNYFWLKVN